jgi:hypothetical protein
MIIEDAAKIRAELADVLGCAADWKEILETVRGMRYENAALKQYGADLKHDFEASLKHCDGNHVER